MLTWLHISDLHLRESTTWDSVGVLRAFLGDLREHVQRGVVPDLIFFSGDAANSGAISEFTQASVFLAEVATICRLDLSRVFVVPGNHDVDRKLVNRTTKVHIQSLLTSARDEDVAAIFQDEAEVAARLALYGPLSAFANFAPPHCKVTASRPYWTSSVETARLPVPVTVIGLNSAWTAIDDSGPGRILLGRYQLEQALTEQARVTDSSLVVCMFHHPMSWLPEWDQRSTGNRLFHNCDFVLNGHLHRGEISSIAQGAIVINGGALYENSKYANGYNLVSVEPSTLTLLARRWIPEGGGRWVADPAVGSRNAPGELQIPLSPATVGKLKSRTAPRLSAHSIRVGTDTHEKTEVAAARIQDVLAPGPSLFLLSTSVSCDQPPRVGAWIGRQAELGQLEREVEASVIVISGIGGQGKSALAAKYVERMLLKKRFQFYDWRDCYEQGDKLHTLLLNIIGRISNGAVSGESLKGQTLDAVVRTLFEVLGANPGLFVFDNVDHYVDLESARPVEGLRLIFNQALRQNHRSVFLFTCRPPLFDESERFFQLPLSGLAEEDTVELFRAKHVAFENADQLKELGRLTAGHPLWLSLIAGQLSRNKAIVSATLADLKAGKSELPTNTLRSVWTALNEKQQAVLRCLAETVRPETEARLAKFVEGQLNWNQFQRSLKVLISMDLVVTKSAPYEVDTFELHPVIRSFIRNEFPQAERKQFVTPIIRFINGIIGTLKSKLSNDSPIVVIDNWTIKAELAINAGEYHEAIDALRDVYLPLLAKGFAEEYVRICTRLFSSIDWTDPTLYDRAGFDEIFHNFAESLERFGRTREVEDLLRRYESTITGKTARYVGLCSLKCHLHWQRGEFEAAIRLGKEGQELKKTSSPDTRFDCAHNLSLAQRDHGDVGPALDYFLRGLSVQDVISGKVPTANSDDGPFFGNVGRCLWKKGEVKSALECYRQSYRCLDRGHDAGRIDNLGYACLWIGEGLEVLNDNKTAAAFYLRALRHWRIVSPPKADGVLKRLNMISERSSEVARVLAMPQEEVDRIVRAWIAS